MHFVQTFLFDAKDNQNWSTFAVPQQRNKVVNKTASKLTLKPPFTTWLSPHHVEELPISADDIFCAQKASYQETSLEAARLPQRQASSRSLNVLYVQLCAWKLQRRLVMVLLFLLLFCAYYNPSQWINTHQFEEKLTITTMSLYLAFILTLKHFS